MRRFAILVVPLIVAACGGLASPDRTDLQQTQVVESSASALGVASRWTIWRYRNFIYNDYAAPGDTTLIALISTDPAFFENRACEGGPPPTVGDDWMHVDVHDVYLASGKENYRYLGTSLFTRVYQVSFPDDLATAYCDLIQGRSGTLLAEGTSKVQLTDLNFCTANEIIGLVGQGNVGTLPAFPCESGKAKLAYSYRYTLSKDAVIGANCSLTAGEYLFKQIEGPTLACIGK
jgi:hypothetical protein